MSPINAKKTVFCQHRKICGDICSKENGVKCSMYEPPRKDDKPVIGWAFYKNMLNDGQKMFDGLAR